MKTAAESLSIAEMFGLDPLGERLREALVAVRGDEQTPKSIFGVSSLKMFRPRLATTLWAGKKSRGSLIAIYNLFNHRQPPPELGWSVRVTNVLDFRGRALTYDSHNGTDFAIAPGTKVCASAPGTVMRVSREFNRGGLKIFIDHGRGLVTTYNHLARSFVQTGQRVQRGEVIALSGYSGLDGLVTFPWGAPHMHYNVWLNGRYVDPFASECDQVDNPFSIWRRNNRPLPFRAQANEAIEFDDAPPTEWNADALKKGVECCRHAETKASLQRCTTSYELGASLLFAQQYFPTRFAEPFSLYTEEFAREARLDLPFRAEDFEGIYFADDA